MSLMIAARGLGHDAHPMDGFDEGCIKKECGILEDKIIPIIIVVEYLRPGALLQRAF